MYLVVALVGLMAFGGWYVYPKLQAYRRNRILLKAERMMDEKDYRGAYFLLDPLVKAAPERTDVRRLLAEVIEVTGPGHSLPEWEYLCRVEPGNAANFVGYATAALRAGQLGRLPEILAGLGKAAPGSLDFHRLSAAYALARGDRVALRDAISAMTKIPPKDAGAVAGLARLQLSLAVLQLASTDPAEVQAARAVLDNFARGDRLRIRATLALLNDAPHRWPEEKNPRRVYRLLAQQLGLGLSQVAGEKQYLWAGVKREYEPDLQDIVHHMQSEPAPLPEDIVALGQWMLERRQGGEALVWLESLDPAQKNNPAVLSVMAGCALTIGYWPKLEQFLLAGAWGPVPAEAVRYAFEARRAREAGSESKAESLWNSAVRMAEPSLPGLRMLYRLAEQWRWTRKMEQALWALVRQFPSEQEAWQKLSAVALTERDTTKVWRVYSAWAQADPTNMRMRLSRAVIGIFVRPGEPGLNAEIEEVARLNPGNPGGLLAQGMLQWRAGRFPEALAQLDKIPIASAAEPRLALARGLVLASLGRTADAEEMFKLVPADLLLPEETALIAAARKRP